MKTLKYVDALVGEIREALNSVDDERVEALADRILSAPHIFVTGIGRSGLSSRAFAMRLMHMGFPVYIVGEIVTPSFKPGDLLIVCSGSGETGSQALMAQKAKALGGAIALVTIQPGSTIGAISDLEIHIKAPTPKLGNCDARSIQPMGSLFEQCTMLVLDLLIVKLMERTGIGVSEMIERHVNLE
ncbi:MAG: 6-phospho-3-hexuloisomerase [Clostridiales bacterium]|nr:6-phospho-3-hexuloisomerase [Clostridiales bacterium]